MRYVLIADDHEITRRGLREILKSEFGDLEFGEVGDLRSVTEQLPKRPWDLLLLDILMPGGNVLDAIKEVRDFSSTLPILILTAVLEMEYVTQTLRAGANGLIHKHRASEELLAAVRAVLSGQTYLHPETAAAIAVTVKQEDPHERLSERELQILRKIALGLSVKEVASELHLSDKTVATYLARIRDKTGLSNHVQIARYALRKGIVD